MWTLSLDATQKELIAQLEASREAWQTTAAYDPERYQDPPAVRQKKGAALRKQVPHEAHAPKDEKSKDDTPKGGKKDGKPHFARGTFGVVGVSPADGEVQVRRTEQRIDD